MSTRTRVLALGTFAVGTSGYIVAGVLPAVASELTVSVSAAGQLITAFALAYAIASPLLAAATAGWERRTLLVVALLVCCLGNAVSAVAANYPLLLASRVVTALGAAVYTPAATVVATALVPPERRARAIAMVFGGLTTALIVGVPAGTVLGSSVGYRGVFALVAAVSLLAAVAVRLLVPPVEAPPAVALRARFAVAADRRVLMMLIVTLLGCLAAFSVYTYIAPLLARTAGVHGTTTSVLLFAYGVGGAIGNLVAGRAVDRYGWRTPLLTSFVSFTVLVALLPVIATAAVPAAAVLFLWGLSTWSVNPPIQQRLVELSPNAGLTLSLNASAIYLGVGCSGALGGIVMSTAGPLALGPIAAVLGAGAVAVLVLAASGRRGLDVAVRAREDQRLVAVGEPHQEGRAAVLAAGLDDLALAVRGADDSALHVQPVTDGCSHGRHLRGPA